MPGRRAHKRRPVQDPNLKCDSPAAATDDSAATLGKTSTFASSLPATALDQAVQQHTTEDTSTADLSSLGGRHALDLGDNDSFDFSQLGKSSQLGQASDFASELSTAIHNYLDQHAGDLSGLVSQFEQLLPEAGDHGLAKALSNLVHQHDDLSL